jgi:hypothetical protein
MAFSPKVRLDTARTVDRLLMLEKSDRALLDKHRSVTFERGRCLVSGAS